MKLVSITGAIFALTLSARAEIVIGVAGPMSGQNAPFGEQMKAGVQAAVDAVNAQGGINGELLTVEAGDDGCDARRAVAVAKEFVAKDVRFVVGHFCTGAALAAAEIYSTSDIIMLSPTASTPRLTEGKFWNVFRLSPRDDYQAQVFSERVKKEVPAAKVAVVSDGSPLLAAIAEKVNGAVRVAITPGQKAFPDAVAAIQASGANVVYLAAGGAEAGTLAGDLKDAGVTAKIYGPDSLLVDAFWERAGIAGEGALATFPADPVQSPKAQQLVAALGASDIPAEGPVISSYAAVEVFVAAAKVSSVNDGKALASKLKWGSAIDTVLGPVAFDQKGDVTPQRFDWYRWSQGSYAREQTAN